MNITERIIYIVNNELIPAYQSFKSYEQLANKDYRFSPKIFAKCADNIQSVISLTKTLQSS